MIFGALSMRESPLASIASFNASLRSSYPKQSASVSCCFCGLRLAALMTRLIWFAFFACMARDMMLRWVVNLLLPGGKKARHIVRVWLLVGWVLGWVDRLLRELIYR